MPIRSIAVILASSLTIALCGNAAAQLTITEPDPSDQPVRQVSLSSPPETPPITGIVGAPQEPRPNKQIGVTVRYLLVDAVTREAIYRSVDADTIRTSTQFPEPAPPVRLDGTPSQLSSLQQIRSPARVTCCVLGSTETADVLQRAADSAVSDVTVAPNVILLDGTEAEMNDVIQRPFVIDMQTDGELIKPAMEVLDDGTRLRLLAKLTDGTAGDSAAIDLTCEIVTSRILDVKTDHVFGVQDQPVSVQAPIHQVITAIASAQLGAGQTLLVDPHVTKTTEVRSPSGVPMLAKIPYVGRRFRNPDIGAVERHMIVLLQPSIAEPGR